MVDIKHSRLPAFKKNGLALIQRNVQHILRIRHVRAQAFTQPEQLIGGFIHIYCPAVIQFDKHLVFLMQGGLDFIPQMAGVVKVMDTDAYAVYFISVCRADPSSRCANLMLAQETFCYLIDHTAERGNDMGAVADQQPGAVNTPFLQPVDLPEQDFKVNNHPIADHRDNIRADDPRRQQMESVGFIPHDYSMPGIVSAVKTCNIIDFRTDKVGCFAFALIPPLGSNQNDSRHILPFAFIFSSAPGQSGSPVSEAEVRFIPGSGPLSAAPCLPSQGLCRPQ